MTNHLKSFTDLAEHYAQAIEAPDYESAFLQKTDMAQLSFVDEPTDAALPDAEMIQAAIELMMSTCFDAFRDTRLQEYGAQVAWGICDTFHRISRRIDGQTDDATFKLREMVKTWDPSEIYQAELEEATTRARSLEEASDAFACMRDHASKIYAVETGRPYSAPRGSMTSSRHTAATIDARDFIAARAQNKREQYAPTGPVVVFSGGQEWSETGEIEACLDFAKQRIPNMVLATTAQNKGADVIAQAWAARNDVKVVMCRLDMKHGRRAAFVRNDRMIGFNPVEAIICQGSGIQLNLCTKLREKGVPLSIIRHAQPARELQR